MARGAVSSDDSFDELLVRVAATSTSVRRNAVHPGAVLLGRFDVESKLGRGAMGQVFTVFDRTREERLALKLLGTLSGRSIGQLKHEFRATSETVHPNLVRLHELLVDGSEWFFTMDLIEGVTLPVLLRERPVEGRAELRDIFTQLAHGLHALHEAGTLHRDLKPSNFLIAPDQRRVVLLDFGLAHPIGNPSRGKHAGTPAYMAPEQQLGEDLSEAADWYAFGVVLYEALTGALPNRMPSRRLLATAPPDLRELCWKLLDLTPCARPGFEHILEALDGAPRARTSALPRSTPRPLLGRQADLKVLDDAFARTLAGEPAMVLVRGPSGIGKTTLVEHFIEGARQRGALVLTSRCREREGMSYKAVDGLIDHLVEILDERQPVQSLLGGALPPELGLLFPTLEPFVAPATRLERSFGGTDQMLVRERAVAALRTLFERLRARSPLVVWVDDLQWSDPESAVLLAPILGGPRSLPLLFIGGVRDTLSGSGPLLESLEATLPSPPATVRLALGPLTSSDAERLALSVLPRGDPSSESLARRIAEEAAGHPLFVAELAHDHVLKGGSSAAASSSLFDLITARVRALPDPARTLLQFTAIAGAPISRLALRLVYKCGPAAAESALDDLKALRLARSQGLKDVDLVDVHHDRIREIILQGLDDAQRQALHLDLATTLEAIPSSQPEELATHFESAGKLGRAGPYWVAAGDRALKALAFSHAASLYERALRQMNPEPAQALAIQGRRAEALAHAGRGQAAAELYLSMVPISRDQALDFQRRAAEQLLLSGQIDEGFSVLERVLQAVGMRPPRRGARALPSILLRRLLLRLRGLGHRVRSENQLSAVELARVETAWTIACSLSLIDPIGGADYQTTHLLLALRLGEPRRLLRALTLEISYSATSGPGSLRRTDELLGIAQAVAQRVEDQAGDGLLHLARGIAAYLQGRHETALHQCERALIWFRENCAGAVWEMMSAQRFVIASLFFLGKLKELGAYVPPLVAAADETGNRYATTCFRSAYSTVAWLARGQTMEASRHLALARAETASRPFDLSHYNLLIGETFLDLYAGRVELAYLRLVAQWPQIARSQFLRIGVVRVQLLSLRGIGASLRALALREKDPSTAQLLKQEAERLLERLRKDPIAHGNPFADTIEANLKLFDNSAGAARERLESAAKAFDRLDMRLFAAAARVRRAELQTLEADGLAALGFSEFEQEGVRSPRRLINVLVPYVSGSESDVPAVRLLAGA
jgi:tetratricopeptide (TPR) repeat protein